MPGAGTDQLARGMAQAMQASFPGATVVVENKPGAGGIIAAQAAARAAPDGHTLFITTNTTQSANPHLFKKLPYDPVGDFAPLAAIARGTMVLVVPTSSPYRTVAGHARPPPRRPAAATTARASPASAPAAPA